MMQVVEVLVGGIAAVVGVTLLINRLVDIWQKRKIHD